MRKVGLLLLSASLALVSLDARAQGSVNAAPEFEVASVRPSGPSQEELNGFYTYPGGGVACKGCRVAYLIMEALDVQPYQISGGPDWIDLVKGEGFDIQAKPPDSSLSAKSNPAISKLPPNGEQREMLLKLLTNRFQLKVDRRSRQGRVLILSRGRNALKLSPPAHPGGFPWAGGISGGWLGGGMRGENISMPQLAQRLSRFMHCPVLDQTGLEGSFDFNSPIGDEQNDADIPGTLRAAMDGIGLKLVSGRGPVESIVVEHVERPSEN